jgi:hypothetical protein
MTELPTPNYGPAAEVPRGSLAPLYRGAFELGRLQEARFQALKLFEHRFGIPDFEIWSRVQAYSREQLVQLALALLDATSLTDLGLDG